MHTYNCAGEFGVVYKGILTDWNKVPLQVVAVKTLRGDYYVFSCQHIIEGFVLTPIICAGLFSSSDVESIVSEIVKMQEFHHPHIMSLIGVCLDAGPGVSIVMPFMANGNLLEYLKRERPTLELDDDAEIDQVWTNVLVFMTACPELHILARQD